MIGPVGPVRSESDHFGLVKLVRPIRFVCKDNRTGPIPRTNERTDHRQQSALQSQGQQLPELPFDAHRDRFGDQSNG
jgi:hypothetical protein